MYTPPENIGRIKVKNVIHTPFNFLVRNEYALLVFQRSDSEMVPIFGWNRN